MSVLCMAIIGKGAYTTVYDGQYNGNDVAVKIHKYSNNPARAQRFDEECKILQQLNHPNIIRFINRPDQNILVLELMDSDLAAYMSDKRFNLQTILHNVASGIKYLHTLDQIILHRDIKPNNVLIKQGIAVLSDFGFSVILDKDVKTITSDSVLGTPLYMAVELVIAVPATYSTASDMWSFGILAWMLVTKEEPYLSICSLNHYKRYIIDGGRPTFNNRETFENHELLDAIEKCWDSDPNKRPSASDFVQLLE